MVSHPWKFDGYRHCGSGNINIPAIMINLPQMRDVTSMPVYACPLTSTIFIFCKAHGMPCLLHKHFPGSAMKFS